MPTPSPSQLKPPSKPTEPPRRDMVNLVRWLVNLPRITRIILCSIFSIAVTLGFTPIIDYLYISFIYRDDTELAQFIHSRLPTFIEIGVGLVMYIVGWMYIIGTRGETPPARPIVLWYFGIGALAVFLMFLWVLQGMASGTAL
jgi:hypothetical protein